VRFSRELVVYSRMEMKMAVGGFGNRNGGNEKIFYVVEDKVW
jgi:hypothetical protein